MPTNPFQYTKPVPPAEVIDRDLEISQLVELAEEGNNARLVAPRRYGKTSVLGRVGGHLTDRGWVYVYVDLLGIVSIHELARRIEIAYEHALKGPLARWFTGLRRSFRPAIALGGGPLPASATLDLSAGHAPLEDRLELPRRVFEKSGHRVFVVFDEFHEILKIGSEVDAVIRSVIQHDGMAASYVFAGSEVGMMEAIFSSSDHRRAFYTQSASITLKPLEAADIATFVGDRFDSTGKELGEDALGSLLDFSSGHPQRAMFGAHELWGATTSKAGFPEWERALEQMMSMTRSESEQFWTSLGSDKRRVLAAIAIGLAPYSERAGASRGGAVKSALDSLKEEGVITKSDGRWSVIDPILAAWLRRNREGSV